MDKATGIRVEYFHLVTLHFQPKGSCHVFCNCCRCKLDNVVFYTLAILLKIVIFFCLFGHHMSGMLLHVLLSIASIMRLLCCKPNIVQFPTYQKMCLRSKSLLISLIRSYEVEFCSLDYVGFWEFGSDFPPFFIMQTSNNFADSNKTAVKPKSGRKK